MEGMEAGLTDLDLWSALVGIGMPPLVAVAVSSRWQPWQRGVMAVVMCVVAGMITTWIAGDLTGVTPIRAVLVVAWAAFGSYRTWWHTTGITKKIEDKTTPRRGTKRRRRPRPATPDAQKPAVIAPLAARPSSPPRPPWQSPPPGPEWFEK